MRHLNIDSIIDFAEENGGKIFSRTLIDMLKSDNADYSELMVKSCIDDLEAKGIVIISEGDEDYPVEDTDAESFIPSDVNISQKIIPVYNLMERLENNEIDLQPDFQRHGGLWGPKEQSRLIESLMLKIPIPDFYFNASDDNCWIVIDGLQRLTAFQNYLIKMEKLTDLQYLKEFNGYTFDTLPRQYVRRIKESTVVAYNVEKGSPDEVVFNIFQRINTGGVRLNSQEIRHALYQGRSTSLMQELAECEEFLRATQNSISSGRMMDREYVNRYLAFTELDYRTEYKDNIDAFLIKGIKRVNTYDEKKINEIRIRFKSVMQCCNEIFDIYAFRRVVEGKRGKINKAIFEIWSVCLSELDEIQRRQLVEKRELVKEEFGNLLQTTDFQNNLKSGKRNAVIKRIDETKKMIGDIL